MRPLARFSAALLGLFLAAAPARADIDVDLPGDIDGNNRVDAADLLRLMRHVRGDSGYLLTGDEVTAADIAPVVGGVSTPDGDADVADLAVLTRVLEGDIGPAAPHLNEPPTSGNPISVSGTAEAGMTIHLFVNGVQQVAPKVNHPGGLFTFNGVALLADDNDPTTPSNPMFAVTVNSGLASRPSNVRSRAFVGAEVRSFAAKTLDASDATGPNNTVVWTRLNHLGAPVPFTFTGNLTVPTGFTLIVTEGTTLQFGSTASTLKVDGALIVQGTANNLAQFNATSATWVGILANTSTPVLTVDHAQIKKATNSINVDRSTATIKVTNSWIYGSSAATYGIRLNDFSTASISGNHLLGLFGIAIYSIRSPSITGNELDTQIPTPGAPSGDGIRLSALGGTTSAANKPILTGNTITKFATGIRLVTSLYQGTPGAYIWPAPRINDNTFFSNSTNLEVGTGNNAADPLVINAENNDWGVFAVNEINSKLAHRLNNPTPANPRPLVDFAPFEDANGALVTTYVLGHVSQYSLAAGETPYTAVGPIVFPETAFYLSTPPSPDSGQIPPGVTIEMDPGYGIDAYGMLRIGQVGGAPVTLCAPPCDGINFAPGAWPGITIHGDSTADSSFIRNASISDAARAVDVDGASSVTVTDSTVRHFSEFGIRFTDVSLSTPPSQILRNTVDGGADSGEPAGTGIAIVDSDVELNANTVQNSLAGVHVQGASDPQIGSASSTTFPDNTISANTWGVWLEATASGQPNPVLTRNSIAGNNRVPDPSASPPLRPPANLRISGYPEGTSVQVFAQENYWGIDPSDPPDPTADEEAVLATIAQDNPQNPVVVDVTEFTDSDGVIFGGSQVLSSVFTSISSTADVIKPTVGSPSFVDILFTTLVTGTVDLRICPELNIACESVDAVWSKQIPNLTAAAYSERWDGKDQAGDFVPDEAYVYVLTLNGGTRPRDRYDPPRNVFDPVQNPNGVGMDAPVATTDENDPDYPLLAFNAFENDFLKVNYHLRGDPSRAKTQIRPTEPEDPSTPWFYLGSSDGIPIDTPNATSNVPLLAVWDGRNPAGELLSQFRRINFPVPPRLKPNFVIVERTRPKIRGPELGLDNSFDEVEVRPDPFRVTHSYDQVLGFKYCIDQSTLVTIKVLRPGTSDPDNPANVVATLLAENTLLSGIASCTPANAYSIPAWDGRDSSGKVAATVDGVYTLAIDARNPLQSNLRTIYRGVLQLRR